MTDKIYNVLFLCTGNSARSIIGEVLMNHDGAGRFKAYSAGSHPKGDVHPVALETLAGLGFSTEGLRSKSWNEFTGATAPAFDFIFTVCDNAARETCPVWIGHPMTAHWGIKDPAAVEGEGQRQAFIEAVRYLRRRIELFMELPLASLDKLAMERKLQDIGHIEGATQPGETGPGKTVTGETAQ
jgi:arsenate reductase (thioredoxin)